MNEQPKRSLTLFDTTCLIVGIIVGAGLYETAPLIADSTNHLGFLLGLWLCGGIISFIGSLCYAELATAYPREGGDYVYLSKAYGPWAGFLFGWIQLTIVRPGDIAVMAFVFARYARAAMAPDLGGDSDSVLMECILASIAVIIFTAINIFGIRESKWTQNALTVAKAIGLLSIVSIALITPGFTSIGTDSVETAEKFPVGVALVLVLFSFGGWNEMVYVAAEIKNPQRNIVRAMTLGLGVVLALYLLANLAFVHVLGMAGVSNSDAVAIDVVATQFPGIAATAVGMLIAISALGAMHGLILTGARISYAVGTEHRLFQAVGLWNQKLGTPTRALVLQACIALVLINLLENFTRTLLYTAAAVYLFYLFTSLSVIILRWKEPDVQRPFQIPLYPWSVIVFAMACGFMTFSAVQYKPKVAVAASLIILMGLPIYLLSWFLQKQKR
ncbi:MAG: amino acid permease [Planctomycetaceae bacterium]|nr:amino acid permease [Planctomycetaceae bacterium]